MSPFTVQLQPDKTVYELREPIRGRVTWQGPSAPKNAELRLFWRTEGKGDRDSAIVEPLAFDQPMAHDERTFSFLAPIFPPSFSGRLISLVWGLELALNGKSAAVIDLTISPRSGEVTLDHPEWITFDGPPSATSWFQRK